MCYRMNIILGKIFQLFENVKTILTSWAVQKQVAHQLWPRAVVCPPVCEGREVRDHTEQHVLRWHIQVQWLWAQAARLCLLQTLRSR